MDDVGDDEKMILVVVSLCLVNVAVVVAVVDAVAYASELAIEVTVQCSF